jgi:DNA-binding MarR family transcriptional regulator
MRDRQAARLTGERRVGTALREIRRGTAMLRLKALVLGEGPDAIELGGADTLALVSQSGGCRMSDLADALRVDASTATRAVARLEKAGLVDRQVSPTDRRVVHVVPTRAGVAAQGAMLDRYDKVMGHICADFDDAEIEALAALLDRLVAGIDSLPAVDEATLTTGR